MAVDWRKFGTPASKRSASWIRKLVEREKGEELKCLRTLFAVAVVSLDALRLLCRWFDSCPGSLWKV